MMEGTVMERTMTKSRTTIRPDLRPRRPDLPHLRRAAKNRKSDQSPWIWIWAPPRTPTRARTSSAKNNTPRNTKRRWRRTRAPWRRRSARRLRRRVRRRVAVPAACPSLARPNGSKSFTGSSRPRIVWCSARGTPRRRTRSSRNTSARTTRTCTRTSRARL